ncbi:hypothetical protein [Enterobacter cloacae]|uniref:tail fiber/spike domain-containing protein n=1 Tax=Enterobacter cloacae TaxID=550 RepID=UPI003F46430B
MATTPTQNSVPSESPIDLKFNAGKIDEFVTSMGWTYTDRFGNQHYTIEGLRWLAQQAISQFGYITLDSFEDGNTLTLPNQVLHLEATGEYYRWDGALPKVVPDNSTPETTGGIGPGAWLSVGDATLRGEVFALNGGVTRGFQTVADMKSFGGISPGHTYSTAGYYSAGDGGGALYIAATSGSTPDGYGDHVASNGIFLRLISEPTDLNHGVIVNETYDPARAWNNRNALQSMMRNERWSRFKFVAKGTFYLVGGTNIGRDYITLHITKGCRVIGRYDDPSIPNSTVSQAGQMIGFAHFFDPDNGDFIPWRPGDTRVNPQVYHVLVILDGEVSTEYNSIHTSKNNNNAIAFLKGNGCKIIGSGGCIGSDHRSFNFDADGSNSNNAGGSVNCEIDVGYSYNVVNNHCMISGSSQSSNAYGKISIGYAGKMLSGGINTPIVARVAGGQTFEVNVDNFDGDGVIKPALVAAYNVTKVLVKAGRVSGATKLLYQYNTLYSDVTASQIYGTPIGIERAGNTAGMMKSAWLHDIDYVDSTFNAAFAASYNVDAFNRLLIRNNNFGNASPSFVYYSNKQNAGLPLRYDNEENISPSSFTVVDFNRLANQRRVISLTPSATTVTFDVKAPDWNFSKVSIMANTSAGIGAIGTFDLMTRLLTADPITFQVWTIAITTTMSGSNMTLTIASTGATLRAVTLHN